MFTTTGYCLHRLLINNMSTLVLDQKKHCAGTSATFVLYLRLLTRIHEIRRADMMSALVENTKCSLLLHVATQLSFYAWHVLIFSCAMQTHRRLLTLMHDCRSAKCCPCIRSCLLVLMRMQTLHSVLLQTLLSFFIDGTPLISAMMLLTHATTMLEASSSYHLGKNMI